MSGADSLPADFTRTITALFPEKGPEWLAALPALVADCARRWRLVVGEPFANLSYHFVAPARRADGTPVVLKIGAPNPELRTALEALRHFDGRGAVRLLDADAERGALLLERAVPGTPLSTLDDDHEATRIAATVMRRLWRPPPSGHAFPTVAQWAAGLQKYRERFAGTTGPLPTRLVSKAEALMADLLRSAAEPVLLHGDVHHFNIVSAGPARWVAIDPKGVVGERAYEVARFLHNPPGVLTRPDAARLVRQRVDAMAEVLDLDPQRVLAWGFCKTLLSAWWGLEDGMDDLAYCLICAELMDTLL